MKVKEKGMDTSMDTCGHNPLPLSRSVHDCEKKEGHFYGQLWTQPQKEGHFYGHLWTQPPLSFEKCPRLRDEGGTMREEKSPQPPYLATSLGTSC